MRVSIFLLLASLALLTVSIVHSSDVDSEIEWIQPAFVEEAESSVSDWDALVARAYDAYLANPTPSHAMMETAVGVEAQVAATLTAHGKTEAELLAELEQRSPNLWAEFKAKFQSLGVKIDNDAARFKVFALNLLTVAKKNAAAFFSHVAREHRAVFSHMTPFAHLTVAEFKSMNKLRAHRPARRSLLQVDAGADLDLDAELDAEAEVDSEEAAEDALEAEEDAKAASFLEMELPGPGQACGAGGTCTAQANWCAAPKHLHHGLCSGTAICCEPPGAAAPVTPQPAPAAPAAPASGVAPDFDWRAKGTAIKYQDQCGCCFAFATASVLESRWNIKHGLLETLSPQQVMDCVAPKAGCSGGDILQAAENYVDHGAALTEAQYPFLKAPGPKCSYGAAGAPRPTSAAPYDDYPTAHPNENKLGASIAVEGPALVGIDASSLQLYTGGIFTDAQGCNADKTVIDHAVVIEGLGTYGNDRAWIVRNSWGNWWAESGRFRMLFGSNTCSIATYPVRMVV